MARSQLTVFGTSGHRTAQLPAEIPADPSVDLLAKLFAKAIKGKDCRYAVVRTGRRVRALYLADDLVPRTAVRLGDPRGGLWITRSARLGDWGGGRVFYGPQLFFRQVDLAEREAWLAPVLVGFGQPAPEHVSTAEPSGERQPALHSFSLGGRHYYYATKGWVYTLYGAGNTPPDRVSAVREAHKGADVSEFMWAIGALPLNRPAPA